ncbi:DNA polymerase III subunit delta [Vibrio cincinnatiensis]|jgi:DNA polymerase-3 subunit delta|uniref:DNA polymerase III subunit delta n=1 Tax=Vibrio cincinnatiensis DSM 19608 TaxID=1123491 RepID=A0A1T4PLA1_VIBCI|nr:DNA polymerase III subunit delta [Vibrio cincinnatiensis]MCG3722488.1 DNA polymerase III subunit delta [Vibrio cincinnatiensis]MCG3726467.1 DNA polymerase III subunit delta [Vibrio cincinnatiensis]MCG3736963.1 DNA polymerase III subunit delta [Vibrio cincinnatiensis]MCG3747796.1 DNA polymerase III subunit delta [Vibrio cincinnatiensis]MCG3758546.1 DNA polymerase III subunit delta [Vibrio cincinnatiensis]
MRVYAEKLPETLNRSLAPLYLVLGNEPLLIQESRIAIEHKARELGFEEKHQFTADTSLDWNDVYDRCQSMSLFSQRQLIEIDIPESGINAAMGKTLGTLAQSLSPDVLLVIVGNKLTKAQENSAWFKELSTQGCWVNCLTPDLSRLPQFVTKRCQLLGLKPDAEAVQMLAQWHEGNLFALAQSLEKLTLLYPDGRLTLVRLEESLSRHNHFTAFHWVDALLEGKANRAQRILRQLASEEIETIILIRTIQKELFQLLSMRQAMNTQPINLIFEQYRVWQNKRPLYSAALQRLSLNKLQHLLQTLAQAELLVKTQYSQPIWPLLQQLSVEFCLPEANLPLPN